MIKFSFYFRKPMNEIYNTFIHKIFYTTEYSDNLQNIFVEGSMLTIIPHE